MYERLLSKENVVLGKPGEVEHVLLIWFGIKQFKGQISIIKRKIMKLAFQA